MKNYQIISKVYTSMNIPISESETLVIPPKGMSKTVQFKKIPETLLMYQRKGIIIINEV